jgi:hypothetical protein
VIVVENLSTTKSPARPSRKPQAAHRGAGLGWAGWLRGLGLSAGLAR